MTWQGLVSAAGIFAYVGALFAGIGFWASHSEPYATHRVLGWSALVGVGVLLFVGAAVVLSQMGSR